MNVNREDMSEETRKLYDELRTIEKVSELLEDFENSKNYMEADNIYRDMHKRKEELGISPILARYRAPLGILCTSAPLSDWLIERTIAYTEEDETPDDGRRQCIAILAEIDTKNKRDASDLIVDKVFEKDDITIGDVKDLTSYIIGLRAQGYFLKEKCDEVLYRPLLDSITNSYDRPFPELPMDETTTPEVIEKYLKLVGVLESIDGSKLFDKKDSNFKEAGYWSGIFGAGPLGGN